MEFNMLKVGQIVEGTVIKVEENTIYLDVQYTTEGKIHLDNYDKPAPESFFGLIEIGQKVRARVQKITDDPAQILLSRLPLLVEEKFVKIEVEDNGSGMDEDFLTNRLFKPFESTKSSMGMGIGAYQVREFIQAMGGAILVASEVNIGTSVSITLPIAYAES